MVKSDFFPSFIGLMLKLPSLTQNLNIPCLLLAVLNSLFPTPLEPAISMTSGLHSSNFTIRAIGFSDLVELWVITTKEPMILCARSTSRSKWTEHDIENVWKVCLLNSENSKIYYFQTRRTHCWRNLQVAQRLWFSFFLIVFFFRRLIGCAGKLWLHGKK